MSCNEEKLIVEAIERFDKSSSSLSEKMIILSERIYRLTWAIAILTVIMLILTALTAWLAWIRS